MTKTYIFHKKGHLYWPTTDYEINKYTFFIQPFTI